MRSGNPTLNKMNKRAEAGEFHIEGEIKRATVKGSFAKSAIMCGVVILSAVLSMMFINNAIAGENYEALSTLFIILALSGFPMMILSFIIAFKPKTASVLGMIYCILNGIMVGSVSALFDILYPGIAFVAILATCVVFLVAVVLFMALGKRVSSKFTMGVLVALMSLLVVEMVCYILSLFISSFAALFYNVGLQIGISAISIVIATLVILTDLNAIYRMEEYQMDKQYEWYAAFSLTTTLVWLYMEILRLLALIFSRRK